MFIHKGDQHSNLAISNINFNEFYNQYWKLLYTTAFAKTGSHADSVDLVQELFIHLWEKRDTIEVKESLDAYLLSSLRNRILNHFRNNGIKEKIREDYARFVDAVISPKTEFTEQEELHTIAEEAIHKALELLPEKMKYIFEQNKYHHKTIRQLSEELNIAPQTVKNQLTKAQQRLGDYLKEHKLLFACFYYTCLVFPLDHATF